MKSMDGMLGKRVAAWLLVSLCSGTAVGAGPSHAECDWGPLFSRLREPDGSTWRERALGPVWERRTTTNSQTAVVLRPLWSREAVADANRVEGEWAWPLGEYARFGREYGWRFGVAWYRCFDASSASARWRFWLLPIYLQGRSARGHTYAAVFPLGGHIEEFFGLDTCDFVLWPLWSHYRVSGQTTTDILFPFWSESHGPRGERWRIFPFYGRAVRYGQYEKRFVLWPIWTWARYEYPGSEGTGWILFPLYGHMDLSDQRSHLYLPPFFRVTRGQRMDRIDAPWPFLQYQVGQRSRWHVWPLFGRSTDPHVDRAYALWPILWRSRVSREHAVERSYWLVPFVYWHTFTPRDEESAPQAAQAWKLWPLAQGSASAEAAAWRMLALWPTRDFAPVERSWSAWWTLAEYKRIQSASQFEALWGIVRWARDAERTRASLFPLCSVEVRQDGSEWSVLKGLLGFEATPERANIRLAWWVNIPWSK